MPDEDSHLAVHARSQAHDARLKIAGMTGLDSRFIGSLSKGESGFYNRLLVREARS